MRSLVLLIALIAAAGGCAPPMGGYSQAGRTGPTSSPLLGNFDKLWLKRTIILRQDGGGGGGPLLPFGGGESPGSGFEPFPLIVQATYMDSTLIEAGIREFADLSSMTPAETDSFRTAYKLRHCPNDTLFVWVELSTSSTPEFLNLDRWTIFIENDEGRDFEPGRIVEHPLRRGPSARIPAESGGLSRESEESPWSQVSKDIECYFPLSHFGDALIGKTTQKLRFVFLDSKHPRVRAEADWDLPPSSER